VPFGVEHPQVARLGRSLARAGIAALMYWSPAMRDQRLKEGDIADIAAAFDWLTTQPGIDSAACGMIGTCVGASFAFMAAAHSRVRDRVSYLAAFAPYASMWTFARDIASDTKNVGAGRERWEVDPLTRTVFVRTLTADLEPSEAKRLREAFADRSGHTDMSTLSTAARRFVPMLGELCPDQAEQVLQELPQSVRSRLDTMLPISYADAVRSPLVVICHDVDDPVIPVSESRDLVQALTLHRGVHHVEFTMFKHLDPSGVQLPRVTLLRELLKFYRALYMIVRQSRRRATRRNPATSPVRDLEISATG
jgi:hypothetical protein